MKFASALLLVFVCSPGWAAQSARVRGLLTQMRSGDSATRMQGFYGLEDVPHVVIEPGVAPAVVALLREEEANYDAGASFTHNEEWANYYGLVSDMVFRYIQLTGDMEPLPLVINQPSGPGSLAERNIANLGPQVVPALQEIALRGDVPGRQQAIDIAGIMLQRDRVGVQPLPPDVVTQLQHVVHNALNDASIYPKLNAIEQLGHIGDPADLPLLRHLSDDPKLGEAAARAIQRFGERSRDIVNPGRKE